MIYLKNKKHQKRNIGRMSDFLGLFHCCCNIITLGFDQQQQLCSRICGVWNTTTGPAVVTIPALLRQETEQ